MKKILLLFVCGACLTQLFGQGNFQISSGAKISASSGVFVALDNVSLQNNGVLKFGTGEGTMKFTGNMETYISGNGTSVIDRMVLEKDVLSRLNLKKNVSIVTEVVFSGGLLDLGDNILDLGESGILNNESESSNASASGTGYVEVFNNLHAPYLVNPGNLGAIISSKANPGNTLIRRGNIPRLNAPGNTNFNPRYYDIIPANNLKLNATIRLHYLDAELNRFDESLLSIWKSTNQQTWVNAGFDSRSSHTNYLEKKGINELSRWTLSTSLDDFSGFKDNSPGARLKEFFSIWPNPVKGHATVSIGSDQSVQLELYLYDSKGSLIRMQQTKLLPGTNRLKINMNDLAKGAYFLHAARSNKTQILKIIKL